MIPTMLSARDHMLEQLEQGLSGSPVNKLGAPSSTQKSSTQNRKSSDPHRLSNEEKEENSESSNASSSNKSSNFPARSLLIRGCDPMMGDRGRPTLLAGLQGLVSDETLVCCFDDERFFTLLRERKWDVIMFAPGACRWSDAGQLIPGQIEGSKSPKKDSNLEGEKSNLESCGKEHGSGSPSQHLPNTKNWRVEQYEGPIYSEQAKFYGAGEAQNGEAQNGGGQGSKADSRTDSRTGPTICRAEQEREILDVLRKNLESIGS